MDRLPDHLESNARVKVLGDGTEIGTRRTIDFVGATGSDDGVNEVVQVTIAGSRFGMLEFGNTVTFSAQSSKLVTVDYTATYTIAELLAASAGDPGFPYIIDASDIGPLAVVAAGALDTGLGTRDWRVFTTDVSSISGDCFLVTFWPVYINDLPF